MRHYQRDLWWYFEWYVIKGAGNKNGNAGGRGWSIGFKVSDPFQCKRTIEGYLTRTYRFICSFRNISWIPETSNLENLTWVLILRVSYFPLALQWSASQRLTQWTRTFLNEVRQKGYVESLCGIKRQLPNFHSRYVTGFICWLVVFFFMATCITIDSLMRALWIQCSQSLVLAFCSIYGSRDPKERHRAARQALNTKCESSVSDVVKLAIISIFHGTSQSARGMKSM